MKTHHARRFWWALMYDDPRMWGLWRYVAWALPVAVGIVTVVMVKCR